MYRDSKKTIIAYADKRDIW